MPESAMRPPLFVRAASGREQDQRIGEDVGDDDVALAGAGAGPA
jgi:hypothetical protein